VAHLEGVPTHCSGTPSLFVALTEP
jgi:hypothetical protein